MIYMRTLLSFQVILATMILVGYKTRMASIGSWFLYFSLTLRNTWLNFILDRWVLVAHVGHDYDDGISKDFFDESNPFFLHRYFHHLLFYSMFLPLDEKWAIDSKQSGKVRSPSFVSFGTITFKLFIMWLYWDAG